MARSLKSLLCVLLVVVLLVGCTPTSTPTDPSTQPTVTEPEPTVPVQLTLEERLAQYAQLGSSPDDNYRTWYEIFVYSYCDSNGDGIGDLNGVTSKLDELVQLGVNGIWLMPIHPSSSYHKYNVNDYYAIDPAYGTMEDFDNLLAQCSARGIKVILDLVVNHSSSLHPWFREARDYLRDLPSGEKPDLDVCPYVGYYNFVLTKDAPKTGYIRISRSDYSYEGQFSSDMPDFNWANEDLRNDIKDIMKFWLDKGVHGFRVDAAKEFYTNQTSKNVEVLNWLQETAVSLKPDAYMVAEVWDSFASVANHYASGFCSIFNYPFGNYDGKVTTVVNNVGNPNMIPSYATALEKADSAYSAKNPNYIDAPFLSNHDVGRIFGFVSGNEMRMKMAGAMNLFMSGSAFIYYGEEIGMPGSGNDPSKRAPMYWNAARNNGTTKLPPDCTLPDSYPLGSLEEQKPNEASLYNYYREAIAIRKALPVISHGKTTAETGLNVGTISAQRKTWDDKSCIILMNFNTEADSVDLSAYADWKLVAGLSADGNPIYMNGTTLEIAAYGIAVLIPNT